MRIRERTRGQESPSAIEPLGENSLLVGFMMLNPDLNPPAGERATNDDLVTSFAYQVKNAEGKVIDRIPVAPVRGATRFQAGIARSGGFGTALAVAAQEFGTTVRMTVTLNDPVSTGVIEKTTDFDVFGQQAFFPWEKILDLPEQYLSGQVELLGLNGKVIAVTALDVVSPPLGANVQVSGVEVRQVDGPFSVDGQ